MAAVPTERQVQQMVRQAMRDRAPSMYAELSASGELERVVQGRVEMFDEIFYGISAGAATKALSSDLLLEERVQRLEQADRGAVEQALAVALEFPLETVDEDEDVPEDFEVEQAADWIAENRAIVSNDEGVSLPPEA